MVLVGQHCEMQQKCALLHEQWGEAVEVQVTFENMSSIIPPELRYFTDNVAWQEDRIKDMTSNKLGCFNGSFLYMSVYCSPGLTEADGSIGTL